MGGRKRRARTPAVSALASSCTSTHRHHAVGARMVRYCKLDLHFEVVDFVRSSRRGAGRRLQWALSRGLTSTDSCCLRLAAENDRVEVLAWAHRKQLVFADDVTSAAAGGGHLRSLKWLKVGLLCSDAVYSSAARVPHVLEWAVANGI